MADRPRDGERGRGPVIFRLLDTNRDGRVSKEELAKAGEMFDELDRNHDGQLDMAEILQALGKAKVNIASGVLDLPGVFEDPRIHLDQLSLDAQWKLTGGKIDTQLNNIRFSNADAEGQAQASWHSGDAARYRH